MEKKDIVRMSIKEIKRLHLIQTHIENKLKQTEVAKILGLSTRQIRRIVRRVTKEGERGIIHRGRGRASNRRFDQKIREEALRLYKKHYSDFGPTLASEKLLERDGISLSDETLRLWLIEEKIFYKRRKPRAHRKWRERKQHKGEMIQIDGSHHDWLEGRGPYLVLMGYIDDATGNVFGRFYPYEGTIPVLDSFKRYIKKNKIPVSVYLDKHTTYKARRKATIDEELNNCPPRSQFERAMAELGVRVIHANSPQAKGRIERLFKTFQDRLIKEMRLAGVGTMEEANRFLNRYFPAYNRRFSVVPAKGLDLHRSIPSEINLNSVLSIKEERVVRNDWTISYKNNLYQILEKVRVKKVTVEEWVSGGIHVSSKGRALHFKKINRRSQKKVSKIKWHKSRAHPPKEGHPWKSHYKAEVA
jgi:transposase